MGWKDWIIESGINKETARRHELEMEDLSHLKNHTNALHSKKLVARIDAMIAIQEKQTMLQEEILQTLTINAF